MSTNSKLIGCVQHDCEACKAQQPAEPVNAMLLEALTELMPKNICTTNLHWPDATVVSLDVTLGELRKANAAITATQQAQPEPISVYRLTKKEDGVWLPASEWLTGYPDPSWDGLAKAHPELWSVQRRVTGKQIADGFAKAMGQQAQPERAPSAPVLTDDELTAFLRFDETTADDQSYDIEKPMMRRLAEIGLVFRKFGAYYQTTEYGMTVLSAAHGIKHGGQP